MERLEKYVDFFPRRRLCKLAANLACLFAAACASSPNPGSGGDSSLRDKTLFGKPMDALPAVSPAVLSALLQRQCGDITTPCGKYFASHAAEAEHKALAIPVVEDGLGVAYRFASPQQAYLSAVYHCNHPPGFTARLCDVQTVDGKDIRAWAATALAGHRQALAMLTVPSKRFYGAEEVGSSWVAGKFLRVGSDPSGETPVQMDGVTTYYTQDLVRALMSPSPPLVIDVGSSYDVIPMARSLYRGGLAFDDGATDKEYETRFAGLLKQLSPDINKPVVFYCRSRGCWFSVNAALRARRLGYSQVGWYRGGIESWKAARLPVATAVVKAVVQQ